MFPSRGNRLVKSTASVVPKIMTSVQQTASSLRIRRHPNTRSPEQHSGGQQVNHSSGSQACPVSVDIDPLACRLLPGFGKDCPGDLEDGEVAKDPVRLLA